ncbi:MAG TPA: methionine biosynthesis protein MetW [bacterium]|nr:methionine biosynthesis protein MetW [bacterium]
MKSPTYWHPVLYQLAMRIVYGRWFEERFRAVADAIPDGTSVVDVCCGDGYLYRRFLSTRNIDYLGLDINAMFIRWLTRRGVNARVCDVRCDPIPEADIILMQASLYQFIPDHEIVLRKLVDAARKYVIVTEPVRNLSTSQNPFLSWLGRRLTDPGTGETPHRFNEETLRQVLNPYTVKTFEPSAGGREVLVRIMKEGG